MGSKRILIIDYGMGNVGSIANALDSLGGANFVSSKAEDVASADAFVLPGVGAFPAAMNNLIKLDLIEELTKQVIQNKKPFFGICLGMQLLTHDSIEQRFTKGLGWVDGHVLGLKPKGKLRVPQVGWNNVKFKSSHMMFQRIDEGAHFFFDHSYHLACDSELVVATCEYGGSCVAAIQKENVFATQFHPEKSQRNGLKMLRNFLNYIEGKERA